MGNKQSGPEEEEKETIWPTYSVATLESTGPDRALNSKGLPDDLLALVATFLHWKDLGRVAQVCKTWRRAALKDAVWWHFASHQGVTLAAGDDCRVAVLRAVVLAPDFMWSPVSPKLQLAKCQDGATLRVCVMSPDAGTGEGKTALVMRLCRDVFVEESDPTIEDNYRWAGEIDGCAVTLDVLDTAESEFGVGRVPMLRETRIILVCVPMDKRSVLAMIDRLRKEIVSFYVFENPFVLVLVRTKSDLNLACPQWSEIWQWARGHGAGLVCASAKTGVNVLEAFFMGVRMYEALRVAHTGYAKQARKRFGRK